jgi:hypothetical protein
MLAGAAIIVAVTGTCLYVTHGGQSPLPPILVGSTPVSIHCDETGPCPGPVAVDSGAYHFSSVLKNCGGGITFVLTTDALHPPDQQIVLGADAEDAKAPNGDGSPHTTLVEADAVVAVARRFILTSNDPQMYNNVGCSIDLTIIRSSPDMQPG